jgi:hypothetical protein
MVIPILERMIIQESLIGALIPTQNMISGCSTHIREELIGHNADGIPLMEVFHTFGGLIHIIIDRFAILLRH